MFSIRNFMLFLSVLMAGCTATLVDKLPPLQTGTTQNPLEISGVLQQDQRLDGVIRLTGDLLIPAGRSLSIAPGSRILVVGNDSTKVDPEFLDNGTEILVKGSLQIAGTQDAPVTFMLDEETPAGENWAGIELVTAESANFSHVDIIGAETGILSLDSDLQLEQVNILGSRYGLLLQGGGILTYQGGRISGGHAGLLCFDRSQLRLSQLRIVDNIEEGLYLAADCSIDQSGLQIERNDLGVVAVEKYREAFKPFLRSNRIDFKPLANVEKVR